MAVTRFDITSRTVAANGAAFGAAGKYEFIQGVMHFAVDPRRPDNALIADIELAPRESDGLVHFSANAQVYRPLGRGNGALLADVVNRGNRTTLSYNYARGNDSPVTMGREGPFQEPPVGDGFLMHRGFTLSFVGWQADAPEGRIRLAAPEALDEQGRRLTGKANTQFFNNRDCTELLLADRDHAPLPAADLDEPGAVLRRRGPATVIPRGEWFFGRLVNGQRVPDPNYVCLPSGFETGKIYEISYTAVGAKVIGLGFLALRDSTSFLKYATAAQGNPCAGTLDRAHIFGSSQSGRFIREMLYLGLTADEEGRKAYDGALPNIASSRFGEFNLRFGQPSANVPRNVGDQRAYTYTSETDAATGDTDGLLRRLDAKNAAPKIIAVNSAAEYWWNGASLTHTDATGTRDVDPPPNVRTYLVASTKHGGGTLPLTDSPNGTVKQQHFTNVVDYRPLQRALLIALDRWVKDGIEPPPNRIPRLADGTAVRREHLTEFFESIPGMGSPIEWPQRRRMDTPKSGENGPGTARSGREGEPYGILVSAVDSDGNDVAGVRLPEVSVPLATNTGWTYRHKATVGGGHYIPMGGASVPLPRTRQEREETGDHRPSLEERYASLEGYLTRVRRAAEALVEQRFLLPEDIEFVLEGASARWEAFWKAPVRR
jgi:hypothetical protein